MKTTGKPGQNERGIKMTPREILDHARSLISQHGEGDADKWWYANRFVFARLMLDERKTKTVIKKGLFEANVPCHYCHEPFESKKGVHLHRVDSDRGYIEGNCVLMHPQCHQDAHAEEVCKEAQLDTQQAAPTDTTVLIKKSKLYDDMPFTYWWDISPKLAERLDRYEVVEFACKDSGARCRVPVAELRQFLTRDRQSSRGEGNWGIKVMAEREDELAFEPGSGGDGQWLYLPVTWIDEDQDGVADSQ